MRVLVLAIVAALCACAMAMASEGAWQAPDAMAATSAPAVGAPPAPASAGSPWLVAGIILLAVGVAIGVLEMFVPSGGLLAVCAIGALVGSVSCFFVYDTLAGFAALAIYAAGAPVAIVVGIKLWSHTPLAKGMVLGAREDDDETAPHAPGEPDGVPLPALGSSGTALTPMRPVGFVRIAESRLEAQAESGMIEPGTRVLVVESTPARIVVRPMGE